MPPEETPQQTHDIEWEGPWGAIDPVPHSIENLCVQIEQEIGRPRRYYFPYRTIGKWNWSMGTPETLEIKIGGLQLTVSGTGLHRLAEALNMGNLRLVQMPPFLPLNGEICVRAIAIEDDKF